RGGGTGPSYAASRRWPLRQSAARPGWQLITFCAAAGSRSPATGVVTAESTALEPQLPEQRRCRREIGGIEPLGKPRVDRCEEIAGLVASLAIAPIPGEAYRRAQLPHPRLLAPPDR